MKERREKKRRMRENESEEKRRNVNSCHAELIKMLRPLLIFSQSDY